LRGVDYDIEHCNILAIFLPNLQLNIGKKYIKTAKIIDESLILAIVLRNYSTKPSYIFQRKDKQGQFIIQPNTKRASYS
jgi:hypothetical protein